MAIIKLSILNRLRSIDSDQNKTIREVLATAQLAEHLGYERGTAGILLSYFSSYKVAKTFHTLGTMFPGRTDLGICRGKMRPQQYKLMTGRDDDGTAVGNFEEQAAQLNALLTEAYHSDVAPCGDASRPQQWIVGGGPGSMTLAATLGASYCYSLCHKGNGYTPAVLADYTKEVGSQYWLGRTPESRSLSPGCASGHKPRQQT